MDRGPRGLAPDSERDASVGKSKRTVPSTVRGAVYPSIPNPVVAPNGISTGNTCKRFKRKKKTPLGVVVNSHSKLSSPEIHQTFGTSRSSAYRLFTKANKYHNRSSEFNQLKGVRKEAEVRDLLDRMSENMSIFPVRSIVRMFEHHGTLDIPECSPDKRLEAAKVRRMRSDRMWNDYMRLFTGRDTLNTLVTVIYDTSSLVKFVRNLQGQSHDLLSNFLVVRLAHVFVVVMTDIRSTNRTPADWMMRRGDYTSAFMWVNLKDVCWSRYTFSPTIRSASSERDPKKQKKCSEESPPKRITLNKVKKTTVAGMSLLAYLWNTIDNKTVGVYDTRTCLGSSSAIHLHVKPCSVSQEGDLLRSVKTSGDTNDDTLVSNQPDDLTASRSGLDGVTQSTTWVTQVENFVQSFKKGFKTQQAALAQEAAPKDHEGVPELDPSVIDSHEKSSSVVPANPSDKDHEGVVAVREQSLQVVKPGKDPADIPAASDKSSGIVPVNHPEIAAGVGPSNVVVREEAPHVVMPATSPDVVIPETFKSGVFEYFSSNNSVESAVLEGGVDSMPIESFDIIVEPINHQRDTQPPMAT